MKYIYILLTVVTIVSCNISQKESESLVQNDEFEIFKEAFLDQLWEMSPGWASWAGLHQYDSILVLPTPQNRSMSLKTLEELADSLRSFEIRKLSGSDKIDYYLIRDYIESDRWYLQEYKSHEWNPSNFNIAHRAGRIINENFADITTRLRILLAYLKDVPSYYESALKNIKIPTLEHLELGLIQNRGGLTIFGETLLDSLSISNLDDQEKLLLEERIKRTKDAISKYISSLEEMKSIMNRL